jgi:hypothetical protein
LASKKDHGVPLITCLHTAESNVSVFDIANLGVGSAEVTRRHGVRSELLAAAERGGLTAAITREAVEALRALGRDGRRRSPDLLHIATCGCRSGVGRIRPDTAGGQCACARSGAGWRHGGRALRCRDIGTDRRLFEEAAQASGAKVVVRIVPGAWDSFKAGDRERYLAMIARAADDAYRSGAERVALAQASMAGASKLGRGKQAPLTSPLAGLRAAVEAAHLRSRKGV